MTRLVQIYGVCTGRKEPGRFSGTAHCERFAVRTAEDEQFVASVRKLDRIELIDGSFLVISVEEISGVPRRELPWPNHRYGELIRACARQGVSRVAELQPESALSQ